MRCLPSLGACFAVACLLSVVSGCSSSSSPTTARDAGPDVTTTEDATADTSPDETDASDAPVGPPLCRDTCSKGLTCCVNADSPNLGFCYNATTNAAFCANEGGSP